MKYFVRVKWKIKKTSVISTMRVINNHRLFSYKLNIQAQLFYIYKQLQTLQTFTK